MVTAPPPNAGNMEQLRNNMFVNLIYPASGNTGVNEPETPIAAQHHNPPNTGVKSTHKVAPNLMVAANMIEQAGPSFSSEKLF